MGDSTKRGDAVVLVKKYNNNIKGFVGGVREGKSTGHIEVRIFVLME